MYAIRSYYGIAALRGNCFRIWGSPERFRRLVPDFLAPFGALGKVAPRRDGLRGIGMAGVTVRLAETVS